MRAALLVGCHAAALRSAGRAQAQTSPSVTCHPQRGRNPGVRFLIAARRVRETDGGRARHRLLESRLVLAAHHTGHSRWLGVGLCFVFQFKSKWRGRSRSEGSRSLVHSGRGNRLVAAGPRWHVTLLPPTRTQNGGVVHDAAWRILLLTFHVQQLTWAFARAVLRSQPNASSRTTSRDPTMQMIRKVNCPFSLSPRPCGPKPPNARCCSGAGTRVPVRRVGLPKTRHPRFPNVCWLESAQ